jgi:hypothetical protein
MKNRCCQAALRFADSMSKEVKEKNKGGDKSLIKEMFRLQQNNCKAKLKLMRLQQT